MIHPHIRTHLTYYVTMIILQAVGFLLVYFAAPNVSLQMDFVVLNSGIYILWASLHHYLHHELHPKIVLEYTLVSFFGIAVAFFLLRMQ